MESIEELRKICQSHISKETNFRLELTLRKFSIYLTKIFIYMGLTGNQITMMMMILGIISSFFFMPGKYYYSLIGIILFELHLLLDFVDGEVARYRKETSLKGTYLDYMTHAIVNPLIFIGLSIGAYFSNPLQIIPNWVFIVIGFITAYSQSVGGVLRLKKYELLVDKNHFDKLKELRFRYKNVRNLRGLKNSVIAFFRIGSGFNVLLFAVIFNLIPYLMLIYGLFMPFMFLLRFIKEIKKV
jgi:phosphatidylglycerophosphate synthase